MSKEKNDSAFVYQVASGAIELRGDFQRKTVWASRNQMAVIFGVGQPAISKHIKNIYLEKELYKKATSSKMELIQNEAGRRVARQINMYNLDVLISVGYRINAATGTRFRQWATKVLTQHITKGYTLDRTRITKNYDSFIQSISNIQALIPTSSMLDSAAILELVKEFAATWVSLDAYDTETLRPVGFTKKSAAFTGEELTEAIFQLRATLLQKGEATHLFAQERFNGSVEGIVGNVVQSLYGKPVYASVEEKAAHLLYFMVKNHPFVDGNKRCGAFAFVWYLRKARMLQARQMHPSALAVITLLVAESDPRKKELVVGLITQMVV